MLAPTVAAADPDTETQPAETTTPEDAAPSPAVPPAVRVPDAGSPSKAGGPPQPLLPSKGFAWEPFGYLRLQYVMIQNDPNVAFVGRDDGFQLQNARIGVRGALGDRAAFVFSLDGATDERERVNVPVGRLRASMRDAYGDFVLGGALVARGGYFHTLVDPQNMIADTSRELVDRPIESRGVRATEGYQTPTLAPGRSLGAAIRLDPEVPTSGARFGFELALQNGGDEFASNNDNDKPAASASLLARFAGDSFVVASVRYNPRTVGELPFRQDENDVQATGGARIVAGPAAVSGGVIFTHTTFPSTGGPAQNAFGAHGQIMVRLGSAPVALGYRFGILDPSSLITTDRVMEHTAAAVLGVPRFRMRLQLQLTHSSEQRSLSNDRAQLAAEVAL